MLENLHVKNLALVEDIEVDFKEGLNILSGETGAGKSIIIGSINLALGGRASADLIRTGMDSALIEMIFRLKPGDIIKVRELGFDVGNEGELLLARKIQPQKSICRINGETVSASQLRELSPYLLDMYGQHEHQTLLNPGNYIKILDEFIGKEIEKNEEELSSYLKEYNSLKKELEEQTSDSEVRKREAELLSFEIEEIENAELKTGEDEELEEKYKFFSNIQKIMEAVSAAHAIMGFDSDESAGTLVGRASSVLKSVSSYDGNLEYLSEQIAGLEDQVGTFVREISSYENSLEMDSEEFAAVENRLNEINRLKDKYGNSIEDILTSFKEKQERLERLLNYETYFEDLNSKIDELYSKMIKICQVMSTSRSEGAPLLEARLKEALKDLNFNDVQFEVNVSEDPGHISQSGFNLVEFRISMNTGELPRPMQQVASGGELSRIMLGLKSVLAKKDDVSTLVFDEIDTGISGPTAYKVAKKMGELAKNHQLICITHLPQIAAMADEHYLIKKTVNAGRTVTTIERLDSKGQIMELARMLGSDEVSESAALNARELKERAKSEIS